MYYGSGKYQKAGFIDQDNLNMYEKVNEKIE